MIADRLIQHWIPWRGRNERQVLRRTHCLRLLRGSNIWHHRLKSNIGHRKIIDKSQKDCLRRRQGCMRYKTDLISSIYSRRHVKIWNANWKHHRAFYVFNLRVRRAHTRGVLAITRLSDQPRSQGLSFPHPSRRRREAWKWGYWAKTEGHFVSIVTCKVKDFFYPQKKYTNQ